MGDTYKNGRTRTQHMRPGKFDYDKARSEKVICEDLKQQLAEMFKRWKEWKCQS